MEWYLESEFRSEDWEDRVLGAWSRLSRAKQACCSKIWVPLYSILIPTDSDNVTKSVRAIEVEEWYKKRWLKAHFSADTASLHSQTPNT